MLFWVSNSVLLVGNKGIHWTNSHLYIRNIQCLFYYAGGEFGAFMQVHIQNDGPVTLDIESPLLPPPKQVCDNYNIY